MTPKLDEARLRELVQQACSAYLWANNSGSVKTRQERRDLAVNDCAAKINDALSAERERGDRAVKVIELIASRKQTCASDEVEVWELQGAARAFLATQKAEGAD